jgi:hypothetical protein
MDVSVRSSNDIYDPIRWVGNTGCPAKSSTKGGHHTLGILIPDKRRVLDI